MKKYTVRELAEMASRVQVPEEPTTEQAQAAADLIVKGAQSFYEGLYLFSKIKGWKLLGYSTFTAWAIENLDFSEWTAYQELAKARVLGNIAERLGLPVAEVVQVAPVIPLHDASKMAQVVESEMFETSDEGAVEIIERVKAEVIPSEQAPSNQRKTLLRWCVKVRQMPYPEGRDDDLREALIEASEYIKDCLKGMEE